MNRRQLQSVLMSATVVVLAIAGLIVQAVLS